MSNIPPFSVPINLLSFLVVGYPLALFFQSADMGQSISIAEPLEITKALVTSFFFVGSFAVMGLYMLLLFVQNKKQDYLLYAFYLLLFTFYFFLRIDDVLRFDIFQKSYEIHKHLLTPLLFVITSVYVRFINVFADIRQYNVSFSKRLDIFCVLMFLTAAGLVLYTGITQDFEWVREHRSYFTIPMHLYTLLALIRAFIIIKSKIRHYILWSNIFLFTFSII
ncbi:7TM diverse intracellular signaling domain-containing protein, partial [Robiginitalea sp.]|uniref:7TM diverse intracellular signaling domain-containing protein n=1 Tax=Robiginitalea sp. TaxID=1902411 RepID=UPI003C3AE70C